MRHQDIQAYLHERPFRPFRIHLVTGETYDIRHPEMVKVTLSSVLIFSLVSDDPEVFDRWQTVSLGLIPKITHIETTPASNQSSTQ